MIDLSRTVMVMDGPSDIRAITAKIQKDYDGRPQFRKAACNGHTVTPEGYVNGIQGIVNFALNSNFLHILCILDREKRRDSAKELARKIHQELIKTIEKGSKFKIDELEKKIVVIVADRMLENWIVADIEGIKCRGELIKSDSIQGEFEGKSGVNVLKSYMKISYDKVQHAPLLLKSVSIDRARLNSPSLGYFISVLEG